MTAVMVGPIPGWLVAVVVDHTCARACRQVKMAIHVILASRALSTAYIAIVLQYRQRPSRGAVIHRVGLT